MKYLLFILAITFFGCKSQIEQKDTTFPLTVNINIVKEYEQKLPKENFSDEISKGIYNIKTDSVNQKFYEIEIALKNISTQPILIWLMTCSWQDNFRINNNYINFKVDGCDHNFPELVNISQGESKIYKATLAKSIKFENPCENCIYGPQVKTTKLGLIIVDNIFKPQFNNYPGYDLAMEDESSWKIIWSNPLYLLTKEEASPKPMEIPVYQHEGHQ